MKSGVLLFVAGVTSGVGGLMLMQGGGVGGGDESSGQSGRRSMSVMVKPEGGTRKIGRNRDREVRVEPESGLGDLMDRVAFLRASAGSEINPLELGRLTALIGAMSGEETDAFLLELEELEEIEEVGDDPLRELSEAAMLRLFELDGFAAMQALVDDRYPNCDERFGSNMRVSSMSVWAGKDPDGVRDWVMDYYKKSEGGGGAVGGELFLHDEEVVEAFFLNFERLRPGQSMGLAEQLSDKATQDLLGKLSLKSQIKLAEDPSMVERALDDSLGLVGNQARAVFGEAMAKNLDVCQQWVERQGESEHRNRALLDVGYRLLYGKDSEIGVNWLLNQEVTDVETRKQRLGLVKRQLEAMNFTITESRIEMPVFSNTGEGAFEGFINYGTPIEVGLNNPQRTTKPNSEEFVKSLRESSSETYDGRFVEQIEDEIQALGLDDSE